MITQVQGSELPHGSQHQTIPGNNFYAHVSLTNENGRSVIAQGNECSGKQSPENKEYETPIKELTYMSLHPRTVTSNGYYSQSSTFGENFRHFPTQSPYTGHDHNPGYNYNSYPPTLIPADCLQGSLQSRHSFNSTFAPESYASQQNSDHPRISRSAPPNVTITECSDTQYNANSVKCFSDRHSEYSYPHLPSPTNMGVVCKREITTPSPQLRHEISSSWRGQELYPPPYLHQDTPQYRYSYQTNYWPLSPANSTSCSYQKASSNRFVKQERFQDYQTNTPMQKLPFRNFCTAAERGFSNETQFEQKFTSDESMIGTESSDDMRIFANVFKARRIKLGFTQHDVGLDLKKFQGSAFSQTTICRFEAGGLSIKNMNRLKPLLTMWLRHNDTEHISTLRDTDRSPLDNATTRKRKKRTCIEPQTKLALEEKFRNDQKPTTVQIAKIAEELSLDKEVVRIWFCNRRQKEKKATVEIVQRDVA